MLNQYYAPRVEATAYLLAELCEGLAEDWDVTVVTGGAPGEVAGGGERSGVRVVRLPAPALGKRGLLRRAVDYGGYAALTVPVAASRARPDVVLAMTDPPFVGAVARLVARRFGAPLVVVCQDVFPETAIAVGALRRPLAVRTLRALVEPPLRAAARVVALGETMRARLEQKGVARDRIRVIPNWTDTERIRPGRQDNEWSRAEGLADRFVVMHAGNLGFAQDLDTLLRAAALLADVGELVVAIAGSGSREEELRALARRVGAERVRFLGHQPREAMPAVLASGTVHAVGLARGLAGYVVPSRLYGVLAAGRPVVAHADPDSETAHVVRDGVGGTAVPPGDPQALAAAIRAAHREPGRLAEEGRRARAYAELYADRRVALGAYRVLLDELRDARPRPARSSS